MFDVDELTRDLKKSVKKLDKKVVIREVSKSSVEKPWHPRIKKKIFLTTSALKIRLLASELLELTEQKKFFVALATLRMIIEELALLIFILSKIKKTKDFSSADLILTRAIVGRRTRKKPGIMPYNVITTKDEAEKFLEKNFKKLVGMFEDSYTFISDFVHPNAPSRYYFFEDIGKKIKFVYRDKVNDQDIGMILNYACMMLEMYIIIWSNLEKEKIPT